jgi:hypothetical protein
MIIGEDFSFRDDIKSDTVPVELLLEPYKGVVLKYTKVEIKEDKKNDEAVLKFQYELLRMGDSTETKLRSDKQFEKTVGLVLNTLILEATSGKETDVQDNSEKLIEE